MFDTITKAAVAAIVICFAYEVAKQSTLLKDLKGTKK